MSKLIVKNKYATVPNHILNNPNLSFKAKGLFAYIQSKPEGWDFSADRIVNETKDGREAIKSGLIELEKNGLLVRQKSKNTIGQWEHEYILKEKAEEENPVAENQPTGNLPEENQPVNQYIDSKKDVERNINNKPPIVPQGTGHKMTDLDFNTFWDTYPVVKHVGKAAVKSKFLKLDKTLLPAILNGLEKQKRSAQWINNDGKFIPNPLTWVNQKRWEDEVQKETLEQIAIRMVKEHAGEEHGLEIAQWNFEKKYGLDEVRKYAHIFGDYR